MSKVATAKPITSTRGRAIAAPKAAPYGKEDANVVNLLTWSTADLKEECKGESLPVSGTKSALVARLTGFTLAEVDAKVAAAKAAIAPKAPPKKGSGAEAKLALSTAKKADKDSVVGAVSKLTKDVAIAAKKTLEAVGTVTLPVSKPKAGTRDSHYAFLKNFRDIGGNEIRKGCSTLKAAEMKAYALSLGYGSDVGAKYMPK